MTESDRNFEQFERELRCNLKETIVDFSTVESKLFSRIAASEALGVLSTLKADKIPSADFFDSIEKNLFDTIKNYREYDEPVDECIRHTEDLTQSQWERLEHKLGEQIRGVQDLPEWELHVKATISDPLSSQWESIENNIFTQISSAERKDLWELCAKTDEVAIPGEAERLESLIQSKVDSSATSPWEQVLKTEEVLPYSAWEACEEKLFAQISQQNTIKKQPFWFIIEHYTNVLKTAGVVTATFLLTIVGIGGYQHFNKGIDTIPSLVYQMQGEAVLEADKAGLKEGSFCSVQGGNVTVVNEHGSIAMKNDARVELQDVSKKKVLYRVKFGRNAAINTKAPANVAFFVNKKSDRDIFKVETPDYDIIVKGTYFNVEPDLSGRVSTRVLEGAVKIHSREFGDTMLYAGQCIAYDVNSNRYTINGSGPVIPRNEIEQAPPTEELLKCHMITVKANCIDAEISIDGRPFGNAPITILQPAGLHRVIVRKEGYSAVDTLVKLTEESQKVFLDLQLHEIHRTVVDIDSEAVTHTIHTVQVNNGEFGKTRETSISPDLVAEKLLGSDPVDQVSANEKYNAAQKAEISGNWQNAVALYQAVFDNPASSRLRKEDALFSIGKIRAEHEKNKTEAKQVFLKYLALYPSGSFSGESWLRLAELEFSTNPENSIQYYNKFFEMFPRHPRLPELENRVGVIYLQSKQYSNAISMFKRALETLGSSGTNDRTQIRENLSRALEESGDFEAAKILKKEMIADVK